MEGEKVRDREVSPAGKFSGSRELSTASSSELEERTQAQNMLSRMKASVTPSFSGKDKNLQAMLCLTLATCASVPCTFWPNQYGRLWPKSNASPWIGKGPRATPAEVPPRGNPWLDSQGTGCGEGRKESILQNGQRPEASQVRSWEAQHVTSQPQGPGAGSGQWVGGAPRTSAGSEGWHSGALPTSPLDAILS